MLAGASLAARIYVFYPTMARPNVVQAALAAKAAGNEITVFGRFADFTAMMASNPPDVLIVPKPLADEYRSFRVFLRGTRGGEASVDPVLLFAGQPPDPSAFRTLDLGVVGFLDRPAMGSWVASMVGGAPRLKFVTKLEDLLPLLQFGSAGAVLVGANQVDELRGRSAARLEAVPLPGPRWGLVVAAASREDVAKSVEPVLRALGVVEKGYLGVDGWNR